MSNFSIEAIEIFLRNEDELISKNKKRDFDDLIELLLKNREIKYDNYIFIVNNKNTLLSQKKISILQISHSEKGKSFIKDFFSNLEIEKNNFLKIKNENKELSDKEIIREEEIDNLIFICKKFI